jgi:hypothetical protein
VGRTQTLHDSRSLEAAHVPNETPQERALRVIPEGLAVARHSLDELQHVRQRLDIAFDRSAVEGFSVPGASFTEKINAVRDLLKDARSAANRAAVLDGIADRAHDLADAMTLRGSSRVWRLDRSRTSDERNRALLNMRESLPGHPNDEQAVQELFEGLDDAFVEPASRHKHVPQVLRRIATKRVQTALAGFDAYRTAVTSPSQARPIEILAPAVQQTERCLDELGTKYGRSFSMADISDRGLADLERSLRQLITVAKATDRRLPGDPLGLAELPPTGDLSTEDLLQLTGDLVELTLPPDQRSVHDNAPPAETLMAIDR